LKTPVPSPARPLWILAFLAIVFFLQWARAILIPIAFAIFFCYALAPAVGFLARRARLPRSVGAALVLILLLGTVGWGADSLQPEALNILALVPRATQKFSLVVQTDPRTPSGTIELIQRAASEIERTANTSGWSPRSSATAPGFRIRDYLLSGTGDVVAGITQILVVIALAYLLLIAGDTFRRALLLGGGSSLAQKKVTIRILDDINGQIQRYVILDVATSILFGLAAWGAFACFGLERSLTWGCVGAALHFIPYAGPAAFVLLVALVAYVQFDTLQPVIGILASLLGTLAVINLLFIPWVTHRIGSLNTVAVFLSLLAWGWLWGIWGLLLGVPIVMAINAVCERFESLRPISAFLGRGSRRGGPAISRWPAEAGGHIPS